MIDSPFSQVVVWQGTVVGAKNAADFEKFILVQMNTRAKYIMDVYTNPDLNALGEPVPDTGGRCDVLFSVHRDDVAHFAVPRFQYGMRWLDDVYGNGGSYLYPREVAELLSWKQDSADDEYREDGSETGSVGD